MSGVLMSLLPKLCTTSDTYPCVEDYCNMFWLLLTSIFKQYKFTKYVEV